MEEKERKEEQAFRSASIYDTTAANETLKNRVRRDKSVPREKTGDPIDDISTSELEATDSEHEIIPEDYYARH